MKIRKILLTTFAIVLTFLLPGPVPAIAGETVEKVEIQLINSSEQGISLEVRIPWQKLDLEKQVVEGRTYLKPTLPGAEQSSQPGAPDIPVMLATLGIPFDVALEVSVVPGKAHETILSAPILPVETELTTRQFSPDQQNVQDGYSTHTSVIEDAVIYGSKAAFPSAQALIGQDAVVRQQRVIGVQIFPVQYLPAAGKLIVYESLLVEIRFLGSFSEKKQTELTPESQVYETFFRESLLNYESAKNWRSFTRRQETAFLESVDTMWLPPEPSWRINVRQEGMYRLTYDELETAGLPVTTLDPGTFQLFNLGSEVGIQVNSAVLNHFSPGDEIIFYGEKITDKYTWDNVYWLTFGNATGLRMETVSGTPNTSPAAESYLEPMRNEQNLYYINYIPAEIDFDHFMGKFLMPQNPSYRTITVTFNPDHIHDGSGTLKLALLGYLNATHQATITLNGTALPDNITWDAITLKNAEIMLPAGSLLEGVNTIVISSTNTQDLYYLDWVELVYARELVAANDSFLFNYEEPGDWNFSVEGFSTAELNLFDISNPFAAKQITNFNVVPTGSTYSLEFSADLAAARRYWSGTSGSYLAAASITQDAPSNWQSAMNGADYIIITPTDFLAQANLLANFRASQGLRTAVVDVQDVYDEFGYGITGSEPIRTFLSYAYGNWEAPAPSYVVLMGDGHFDPKNYMGFGRKSFMPPYLANVDPELGETAGDNRYVAIVGEDNYPDMMLGRLAVNTTAEAVGFVDKIIAYEESPEAGDWNQQVLAVSDSYASGWPFPFLSDDLLRCCLPKAYEPFRVYLEVTHTDVNTARAAILEEINMGKLLVNYIGHAAASQWSTPYPGMLNNIHISSLNNVNKYPVFLSMTCWDGYYVYPNPTGGQYEALAEVYSKAANRGAVATWSGTGMGVARGHEYLNQGFFNAIFRDGLSTLGQATSFGKLILWTSTANLDLIDTYLLFGDPASKINITRLDLFLPFISK